MEESILESTKRLLGITPEFDGFDADILAAINYSISVLNQLGVGEKGFYVKDATSKWDDFVDETEYPSVRDYVYLKTRMVFDPPSTSFALQSTEKILAEMEWRLNNSADFENKGGFL